MMNIHSPPSLPPNVHRPWIINSTIYCHHRYCRNQDKEVSVQIGINTSSHNIENKSISLLCGQEMLNRQRSLPDCKKIWSVRAHVSYRNEQPDCFLILKSDNFFFGVTWWIQVCIHGIQFQKCWSCFQDLGCVSCLGSWVFFSEGWKLPFNLFHWPGRPQKSITSGSSHVLSSD